MNVEDKITKYLVNEGDPDKLARWGETFGKDHGKYPDEKGFHELCVEHMEGNIDDAPAYCARVKDAYHGSQHWRGKDKTAKQVKADVKANQDYPKGERKPRETTKQIENKKE